MTKEIEHHRYNGLSYEEARARSDAALNLILTTKPEETIELYSREAAKESGLWEILASALRELPEADPNRAGAILAGLAQRENPKERWFGALHIDDLTRIDHDTGLRLWDQLMRDEDAEVRESAYQTLEDDVASVEDFQGKLGITWQDACNLYRSYIDGSSHFSASQGGGALNQSDGPPVAEE